jgi:protein subunit release factor B
MSDDKRFLRKLKRQIKKTGNRKRRRYLQNVDAPADDFDLGRDRTDVMNEPPQRVKDRER